MTDAVASVPYFPVRCPSCSATKPRTRGRRGRVRYHLCQQCGTPFRSLEQSAESLSAAGHQHPTMTTSTPKDTMTAAEISELLRCPAPAIVNACTRPSRPGTNERPPLLRAGFPRPTRSANGQLLWRRVEVAAHLADPARRTAAAAAALEGIVGMRFAIGGGGVQFE